MNRIFTVSVLFLVFLAFSCAAQTTFSGALLIGRIESSGTGPAGYDPSNEFNSTTWPAGYGWQNYVSGSDVSFTGTAAVLIGAGYLHFSSPVGDWQLDTKMTLNSGEYSAQAGIRMDEWWNLFHDSTDTEDAFKLTAYGASATVPLSVTDAYLRIIKSSGAVTFFYSTNGTDFTEITPAADEPLEPLTLATGTSNLSLFLYGGNATDSVAFDYVRFTTP